MRIVRWTCVFLLLPSIVALADDSTWKRNVELGLVITTGNTDEQNLNSKGDFMNESAKWRQTYHFDALRSSKDGDLTSQKFYGSAKMDHKFGDDRFFFSRIAYEDDRFSGFDYQVDLTVGYGQTLFKTDTMKLEADVGPGVRRSRLDTGDTKTEFILRCAGAFDWALSEHSTFTQTLSSEFGNNATILRSVTGLRSNVNDHLAMKLSYSVKHNTEVPPGASKTDGETSVTLVYSF